MAIVVELLGGVIFDFDVNTGYRNVFRKLDEMVAEMEELRGCDGFGGGQNQLHLGVREAIVTSSRVAAPT